MIDEDGKIYFDSGEVKAISSIVEVAVKSERKKTIKAIFWDLDNIIITGKNTWSSAKTLLRKKWCEE